MLQDYFMFHINKARYELIEEGKQYYGETPGLKGVWATGNTLEECRRNLLSAIEGWVIIRLQKTFLFPDLNHQYRGVLLPSSINMPKLQPLSQRKLAQKLRKLGFLGPYQAGKHWKNV